MRRFQLKRANTLSVAVGVLLAGMSASAVNAQQTASPVKAVWQVQEIYLSYWGLTTYYSCDGLRDKVKSMISKLGAHESSIVAASGCVELSGPERMPGARIVIATPQAATPEVLAAIAKDDKRSALLQKLGRKGQPALDTGEFDAVHKVVTLNIKDPLSDSSAGDCELVEHVRDQIVKKLDAKIVKDEVRCTPHQGTVGNRKLQVDVLAKA